MVCKVLFKEFLAIVPPTKQAELYAWWDSLREEEKSKLEAFYKEGDFFTKNTIGLIESVGERKVIHGYVDELLDIELYEFPNQDYYENLIGHEVYLNNGPFVHICKAHKVLRAFLLLGLLPQNFNCFIGKKNCNMQKILRNKNHGYWCIKI
jgi:hypothetical protein